MSRFSPSDHHDCILATEHVVTRVRQRPPSPPASSQRQEECSENQHESTLPAGTYHSVIAFMSRHRRLFSVLCALTLFGIACLFSTSIVDVLTDRTTQEVLDYDAASQRTDIKTISLDEVISNDLQPAKVNATWITNDELLYYDAERNLLAFNTTSGHVRTLIHFVDSLTKNLQGTELSADQKFLLNPSDVQQRYRFSQRSKFKIYDILNKTFIEIIDDEKFHEQHFEFATFGPNGSQFVFNLHNDLYYKHSVRSESVRLTVTGVPGTVFNGQLDWLYEEDVIHAGKGHWFSPEGTDLAYLMINSSEVHQFSWTKSGRGESLSGEQYPVQQSLKYPKPGTPNPRVSLFVLDLHEDVDRIRVRQLHPPKSFTDNDYYINHVSWYDNDNVLVSFLSRSQTKLTLALCSRYQHFKCQEVYRELSHKLWISPDVTFISAPQENSVLLRTPAKYSDALGEFFQLAKVNVKTGTKTLLTKMPADVIGVESYSAVSNQVFYASTLVGQPEVRHIFRLSLDDNSDGPHCMTCDLGNSCLYNQIKFNSKSTKFILDCQGFEIPKIEVREVFNNRMIVTWTNNSHILSKLLHRHIPRYEKLNVTLPDGGEAVLELILPHNFDESRTYPMLLQLYNAPETQQIVDRYQMDHWSSHLATHEQIIYARVDVRGSSGQGLRHMESLYKNVGGPEIDDILSIVRFIKRDLTYIDPRKIATWGWSYGGFAVLMSLILQQENEFVCGAAVAPVTNWMLYDTAYSERYLGAVTEREPHELTPYLSASILNRIEALRGKRFMLMFGTADSNVHAQHSYRLMMKLNDADIDYESQIYPDDDHTLGKNSLHVYKRLAKFVKNCFNNV